MTRNSEIMAALEATLLAIAGLPVRAAPNAPFKPRLGDPFVRDTYMPIEPMVGSIGVSGFDFPQGLYQIDVMYPENMSAPKALDLADTIMDAFKRGTRIALPENGFVVQVDRVWAQVARPVQGYYIIPVMVRWTVYGG